MKKIKKTIAVLILVAMLVNLIQITAFAADETITTVQEYNGIKDATLELKENTKISANGCDGVIYAHDGATLTINGTGAVHAELCKVAHDASKPEALCGFAMAVWAKNNTTITINGGTYTNDPDTVKNPKQVDLIYASNGSNIVITGGTFKCSTPEWTLNCKNVAEGVAPSTITVQGGRFYKFNPATANKIVDPKGTNEIRVAEGCTVVQDGDWYEVKKIKYNNEIETLNLIENTKISASGCEGVIYAHDDSNIIINGTGAVHGELCKVAHDASKPEAFCGFAMAVWAKNNTVITINGGTYTNDPDTVNNPKQVDLIYASNGSNIVITGGTFNCSTPEWTLNCKNAAEGVAPSTITVRGGRFYKFNPATANEIVDPKGTNEIVVPEGYEVFKDGDWYEVVLAHQKNTIHEAKEATYTEEGNIYYASCDVCGKYFTNKYAIEEITDKNSVIIPKLAEVVDNTADITENAFNAAIKESNEISSSTVVIPVVETQETVTSVTLPVASMEDIKEENKQLAIQTSVVNLIMDTKTLETVINQAGQSEKIEIEIVEAEETILSKSQKELVKDKDISMLISAKILADGKTIGDFGGGKVVLEIPFTLDKNTKGTDYKMIYIPDSGEIEEVKSEYKDGFFVAELNHFSEYAIVKVASTQNGSGNANQNNAGSGAPAASAPAPAPTTTTNNPATGDGIIIYFIALAIALVGICGIVIIKLKRK